MAVVVVTLDGGFLDGAVHALDWTGNDSQITVTGSGSSRTIHVDLDNDRNAANNTSQAEAIIYVNAGLGGLVRGKTRRWKR